MIERVAFLSMHTSPALQPGAGDAGGMNVYVDELARRVTDAGVAVDVYTRRHDPASPDVVERSGYRLHHIEAGPPTPLPVARQIRHVRSFAAGVLDRVGSEAPDILHSHYWLSGWAGLLVKRRLDIPLANSFHTLGRVKNLTRRTDDPPESLLRIAAEHEVIEASDCVVASTPLEAEDLMAHYRADPARVCVSPPGVDRSLFSPGSREAARRSLGLDDRPVLLFVGRVQPLKGIDVAVEAAARVRRSRDVLLLVVGGPSGDRGEAEMDRLEKRVVELGMGDAVRFVPPVAHAGLADYYRAADVLLLPSRSETFGLVAAEAQACGLPVVAARVGGLPHVVSHGESGLLVDGWDPDDHAAAVERLLDDPDLGARLREGAVRWAGRFSWGATTRRFLELYKGAVARAGRA